MKRNSTSDRRVAGLRDSGERRRFGSGAVRDKVVGKGAFHLIPPFAIKAIADQMERGAAKYSARNWEKGMPLSTYLDSAIRHGLQVLAGFIDEPHADAFIWNVACFIETRERIRRGLLPRELDDLPRTYEGLDPRA